MIDAESKHSPLTGYLAQFPKIVTDERPVPSELWPDMPGVRSASVVTWKPTVERWREFWKTALRFPIVSTDYETQGLRPFHGNRIVGVAASFYDGKKIQAGYWNFRHVGHPPHSWCYNHEQDMKVVKALERDEQVKLAKLKAKCVNCNREPCPGYEEEYPQLKVGELAAMHPVFKKCIIGGQNFKFDVKFGAQDDVPVPERVLDSMLIAHLWDENRRYYNLAALGKEIGEEKKGDSVKEHMTEHGLTADGHGHEQVPCSIEAPYAVEDTVIVLRRLQFERERWVAAADPKLMEVFQIENAMTPVFAKMEMAGMKLDIPFIREGIAQLEAEMEDLRDGIFKEAGREFDILSLDQLWLVLEKRGLKPIKLTPKDHKPSLTDFDLGQYKDALCELVKAYRARSKMHGTYFKPFLETHADPDGFLHSDFFIHGTVSGRASCREPNLQNITRFEKFGTRTRTGSIAQAIRQGVGKKEEEEYPHLEVRRCFIPRSRDHSLFFFDYGQMELRVFAEYAEEQFLIKALADGEDIHAATAMKVFPNFPKKEDDEKLYGYFRQLAKQISFGIIYGMGVNKLSVQLDVPVDEAVRSIMMVQAAAAEGFDIKVATTYTLEQLPKILEDHAVMTASRQWAGLGALGKAVSMKINPEPLEEFLFGDPERKAKHQKLISSARTFLNNYHKQFPKIKQFTKGIEGALSKRGYIRNKYGRRYHLPTDQAYVGTNRLVQGSSADMVKVAQWRIDRLLAGKKSILINQVHDEVQVDVHHSELDMVEKIRECMMHYPFLNVRMEVDVDYSHTSWADKHEWEGPDEFRKSLEALRVGERSAAPAAKKGKVRGAVGRGGAGGAKREGGRAKAARVPAGR